MIVKNGPTRIEYIIYSISERIFGSVALLDWTAWPPTGGFLIV
jgi:hypothetical protein